MEECTIRVKRKNEGRWMADFDASDKRVVVRLSNGKRIRKGTVFPYIGFGRRYPDLGHGPKNEVVTIYGQVDAD